MPSRSIGQSHEDEWFDEPDDLDLLGRALDAITDIEDVVTAAGVLMYRVARAQALGEGNKRTATTLASTTSKASVRDFGRDVNGPSSRSLRAHAPPRRR